MSHNPTATFSPNSSEPGRHPEPEAVPRATPRSFSAAYKLRIGKKADHCTERGQISAMLRRKGLYSSQLATWRREREAAGLQAMTPKKRGRELMSQTTEALVRCVPLTHACTALEYPRSSLYPSRQPRSSRKLGAQPTPPRALSVSEKAKVRDLLNSERFQDRSAHQVYPTLLDEVIEIISKESANHAICNHND